MDTTHIIEILISLLVMVIGWFVKTLHSRVDDIEKDMQIMKSNYIARFDDAKTHRYQMQNDVMETLNKIDKKLDVHIARTDKK